MRRAADPISILLADDQDLVRIGLSALFESEAGFDVVAEAADGLTAVAAARRTRPDVVLMDIGLPVIDGVAATRRIVSDTELVGTKVVLLTAFADDESVVETLRAGASGVLLKSTAPQALLDAVRTVAGGGAHLSPSITQTVIREFAALAPRVQCHHPEVDRLTNREVEIVGLVAQGLSNQEIADSLVLSPATARTHVSRAMVKLAARNRAQLVVIAYRAGLA